MKPFNTISDAEDWMDDNASGPMSVIVKSLNMLKLRQRDYSIPADGSIRVTLIWYDIAERKENYESI